MEEQTLNQMGFFVTNPSSVMGNVLNKGLEVDSNKVKSGKFIHRNPILKGESDGWILVITHYNTGYLYFSLGQYQTPLIKVDLREDFWYNTVPDNLDLIKKDEKQLELISITNKDNLSGF